MADDFDPFAAPPIDNPYVPVDTPPVDTGPSNFGTGLFESGVDNPVVPGTVTPPPATAPGFLGSLSNLFSGLSPAQIAALLAGGGATLLGAAGVGQALKGKGAQSTVNLLRQVPTPGANESQINDVILRLLQSGAGVTGLRAPMEGDLYTQALNRLSQTGTLTNDLQQALSPILQRTGPYGIEQGAILSSLPTLLGLSRPSSGQDQTRLDSARNWNGTYGPNQLTREQFLGLSNPTEGIMPSSVLSTARDSVYGLVPRATSSIPQLFGEQESLTNPANQFRMDPRVLQALGINALGAATGNLPALNPNLKDQIAQIYAGRLQDINRYADTGLQDALERARSRGYYGGTEVFREGAPGALLAPIMAEAMRQRGTLAGQQAQSELELAQFLPQLGANLSSTLANIGFSGNTQNQQLAQILSSMISQRLLPSQIASNLETQRVNTLGTAANTLTNAAGAYTTPNSVALTSGSNLINLNRQLAESLGTFANRGQQQRVDLTGAATGAGNVLQTGRLAGAGSSQTNASQPTLLDAFAPTASLLGGVGGLLGGLSKFGNPNQPNQTGIV